MKRGRQVVKFDRVHFLVEAIREFLASGPDPQKIGSAVLKVAIGVELLLKYRLEKICPALILDKIDEAGLQVIKAYDLGKHLITPVDLDKVTLKTANFDVILKRASKFIDLANYERHLLKLHQIRNQLIHHTGEVDLLEVNLLLVQHIFPFLEQASTADLKLKLWLRADLWARIKKIEKESIDAFTSQLAKKIVHHGEIARRLNAKQLQQRRNAEPESDSDEIISNDSLRCPACGNDTLVAFGNFDVEWDRETRTPISASYYVVMICKVCELQLESAEIEHVIAHFEKFCGTDELQNKPAWEEAITEQDFEY
jgi:hypothetical protein